MTAMNYVRVKAMTLGVMCFALFMANIDDTVVNVALPKIQTSLGSSVSGLQWILNAYTLFAASLVLTSGTLSDLYGRKRVFLAGLVVFTIASAVCGFAPNLETLIAGRAIQGVGAAALVPGSLSILTDTFPKPQEKAKALGIWSAVSGLALVAGPVLGGLLVDTLGWQSVFFLNIPIGVIAYGLTSRVVREGLQVREQHLDGPGLLFGTVFLASLTYALIESNSQGWRSPLIVSLLLTAGFSFLAFLTVESRSTHPLLPLRLFNNSTFVAVNIITILLFFTLFGLLFIFTLFWQNVQQYSAAAAGVRFLPMNGAFVIASLVSGWFTTKLGWRFTITAGLILAGVATSLLLRISSDTGYEDIWWNFVLAGFGGGLTLAPLTAAAMNTVPLVQAGIASAILSTSNRIGGVFGVALQGTILTQQLVSDLRQSLMTCNLPSIVQDQIIADAVHSGFTTPKNLPICIKPLVNHQAISKAFVSGLHAAVFVASVALLAGAFIALVYVRQLAGRQSKL
jgi:EmrB/QacA subfamily drug resistance transporter